jgi:hypothetical protein
MAPEGPIGRQGVASWDSQVEFRFLFSTQGLGAAVTHNPGTPAGTYSVTVTGTVTSGSATLTHSFTLKVTVQ